MVHYHQLRESRRIKNFVKTRDTVTEDLQNQKLLTTATPPNRYERRKQETRERLYTAAVALFCEQGYHSTTFEQISARADVARATVFNHFPQKEEFVLYWLTKRREKLSERLPHSVFQLPDPRVQLASFMQELAAENEGERQVAQELLKAHIRFRGFINEEDEAWLVEKFSIPIQSGQQRGIFRVDVTSLEIAQMLCALYLQALIRWLRGGEQPSFSLKEELLRQLDLALDGFAKR